MPSDMRCDILSGLSVNDRNDKDSMIESGSRSFSIDENLGLDMLRPKT
ncbi:MAG: hypothetical protein BWY32_03841 [bacterium ADurb.Bin243]|nr:MAG: hypothetical protein BWY32_03841 [bacterium ADurb.Bin243]